MPTPENTPAEPKPAAPVNTPAAPTEPKPAEPKPAGTTATPTGEPKPFLGEPPKPGEPKPAEQKPEVSEEDYAKALKKDETLLGSDPNVSLDSDLLKAVAPVLKAEGVSPETANKLANALAKAQLDAAKEYGKNRMEFFNKANAEARQKYTQNDFEQINAGIDKWFKPGGVMNFVVRNSELGSDPEFLALMHHLGAAARQDTLPSATKPAPSPDYQPGSIEGISKIW